jgi:uncharacterized protein YecE (DUF72 family)
MNRNLTRNRNLNRISSTITSKSKMIHFGIAGWSYTDWKGIVYPESKPRGFDELSYLAIYFDLIELNNTFYRIPESKMVESWTKRIGHNPNFRFTAKLFQDFTHGKKPINKQDVKAYLKALESLISANRLGCLLAQFPISFRNTPENQERLEEIADYFGKYSLVVEFRHRGWITQPVLDWMEEHEIGFCNVDEPMFRKMIKPSAHVTGPTSYVRFHGRNYGKWFAKDEGPTKGTAARDARYDYLYSDEELDEWVPRIKEMGEKSTNVFVVGNNHFRGQAPANILQLKSKVIEGPVDVPETMIEEFPELKKIARKTTRKKKQPELFEDD